jgi:D-beta-D-heptose 7-phosphate kinase/D-beta-D-heptose 1-phosphate adenosyltransferase
VIGDIMLDRFVYGSVGRVSPEAPVPVLLVKRENMMLGGAGNVISNLRELGISMDVVGVVGDDDSGRVVKQQVENKGVSAEYILEIEDRPTTVKSRFLASNQQIMRSDWETSQNIDSKAQDAIFKHAEALIPQAQAIILSDYDKGVLTQELTQRIIDCAKEHDVPVFVDPKGSDYSRYKGAYAITPNLKELSQAFGQTISKNDVEVVDAAAKVIHDAGVEAIVVTRSEEGMSVIKRDADSAQDHAVEAKHLKSQALEVFDVSGAGDTVIATLAAGLATGLSLNLAALLANIAGGIVVAKIGTAAIKAAELMSYIDDIEGDIKNDKALVRTPRLFSGVVASWDDGLQWVEKWKAKGLRVGFTNGCFDILHKGHTTYLNQARAHCDRLVLGLNSDTSVRRLKGEERPINDEMARATVLAALGCIDMVVIFGDNAEENDMPVEIIRHLKPDVFFKGGDYTEEQLPEAPVVRSYGGDVHLMSFIDGESTTQTIDKIRA